MRLLRFTEHRHRGKVVAESSKGHSGISAGGDEMVLHLGKNEETGERFNLVMSRDETLATVKAVLKFLAETTLSEDRSYYHARYREPTMNERRLAAMLSEIDNFFQGGTGYHSLDRYQRDPMLP